MNTSKSTGNLFITGSILVLIPYIILTIIFDYPHILRHEPGIILTQFHEGGPQLIAVWWAFALSGLPLLIAFIKLGQQFEHQHPYVRWATTVGVISGIVQIIGLLRWVFVVPVLADHYLHTSNPVVRESISIVFQAVHQFGGVLLGEHIGQLFTIIWTVLMARVFDQLRLFPRWVAVLGYVASGIYLLAQTELVATVIPGFPVFGLAGLIGSTLWLIWLMSIGVKIKRVVSRTGEPVRDTTLF
ncbi:hypothetical protein GCM10028803_19590 [Larkinella knui]|uniref:DUF4386 domain-containing protein n=1 Tax=Larkinella knui TaxID=2025310 RepID=A0A3P1CW26_9BACT|nr:DUF4386 domain-containing protein [Larkinella knui]RRB17054.1 DUF4386 domain-containing protein [Larkinella knui]